MSTPTTEQILLEFLEAEALYRRDLNIFGAEDRRTRYSYQTLYWARENARLLLKQKGFKLFEDEQHEKTVA